MAKSDITVKVPFTFSERDLKELVGVKLTPSEIKVFVRDYLRPVLSVRLSTKRNAKLERRFDIKSEAGLFLEDAAQEYVRDIS